MVATQRFDPRPTASKEGSGSDVSRKSKPARTIVLLGLLLLLAVAAVVSTVVIFKNHNKARVASAEAMLYPGSRKMMDVVASGGGRAVSLETSDSFDEVSQWYQAKIKPDKVVQLTERSVIIKDDKVTVTIIGDDNKTNVLLKIVP
jgi:hypothetical protein